MYTCGSAAVPLIYWGSYIISDGRNPKKNLAIIAEEVVPEEVDQTVGGSPWRLANDP